MSKDAWLNWYLDRRVEEGVIRFSSLLLSEFGTSRRRVLDFGCGTGRNTVYLAKLGFKAYAFDWSEASIRVTKQELSHEGQNASNLRVWDMNETPFPYSDSYFDAVLVMRVMHHTYSEGIRRIAAEISRLTKSGGLLYEVPAFERAHRPESCMEPEPSTFVPSSGDETGIPHHFFTKGELITLFPCFDPVELDVKYDYHYCFTARRRSDSIRDH